MNSLKRFVPLTIIALSFFFTTPVAYAGYACVCPYSCTATSPNYVAGVTHSALGGGEPLTPPSWVCWIGSPGVTFPMVCSGAPDCGGSGGGGGGGGAVNGVCSATHYGCVTGTSIGNQDLGAQYSWTCSGSGGGTSAGCTEYKPVANVVINSNLSTSWTITGPASWTGSGTGETRANQPIGTYTISWANIAGYIAPLSQSLTSTPGYAITFNGVYTALGDNPTASIAIPANSSSIVQGKTISFVGNAVANPNPSLTLNNFVSTVTSPAVAKGIAVAPNGDRWVANNNGTISKIPSGSSSATPYGSGAGALAIAYDPVTPAVWVTRSSNAVSKYSTSGTLLQTYSTGVNPTQITYDPTTQSMWVLNNSATSATVTQIYVNSTGVTQSISVSSSATAQPMRITYDPETPAIWVTNYNAQTVARISLLPSFNVDEYSVHDAFFLSNPFGITYDPVNKAVWVVGTYSGVKRLTKMDVHNPTTLTSYIITSFNPSPKDIIFNPDTSTLWVPDTNNTISMYNVTNGSLMRTVPIDTTYQYIIFNPSTNLMNGTYLNGVNLISAPANTITTYEWRDGNCTTGTLLSSAQSFDTSTLSLGAHAIYFRAKDTLNQWSACDSRTVTIASSVANPSPSATIVIPTSDSTVIQGTPVSFTGLGVSSPNLNGTVSTNTYSPVSVAPKDVAYDPNTSSIWISNGSKVTQVNATTGSFVQDYAVTLPNFLTYDSTNRALWIGGSTLTLNKIDLSTGIAGAKTSYPTTHYPYIGIAYDPVTNSVWTTDDISKTVTQINASTGSERKIYTLPSGGYLYGIAFDPVTNSVWVTDTNNYKIIQIDVNTQVIKNTYSVSSSYSSGPKKIVFDPTTNSILFTLYDAIGKLDVYTGSIVYYKGTAGVGVGVGINGIAVDSTDGTWWIANSANTVTHINPSTGERATYPVSSPPIGVTENQSSRDVWAITNATSNSAVKISPASNPISAYEWRVGNCTSGIVLSTASSFNLSTTVSGTMPVYLRVQDSLGNWSTNCPVRTITITPNDCPGGTATWTSGSNTCASAPYSTIPEGSAINVTSTNGNTGGVTLTCTGGTVVQSAPTCTAPSATLSGSGCTIPAGNTTCQASFTWNISGATTPNLFNATTVNQYTTTPVSTASYPITNGSNTIQARDNTTVLRGITVTGTCASGSSWAGGICVTIPAPTVHIYADPNRIHTGESSSVWWQTTNTASCTITKNNASLSTDLNSAGHISQPNITAQTTYRINCVGLDGSVNNTDQVIVNLIPRFRDF